MKWIQLEYFLYLFYFAAKRDEVAEDSKLEEEMQRFVDKIEKGDY